MNTNNKLILLREEGRSAMVKGANKVADAVKVTLGPNGKNAVFTDARRLTVITKDGVSVAKSITAFKDPAENTGAQLIKSIAEKTAETAGDGTTTATVLAQSILNNGMKALGMGFNSTELKEGITGAVAIVLKILKKLSKPCKTPEEVEQVATVSANGDKVIGKLIAKAVQTAGPNGIITVEDGSGLSDDIEVVDGVQFKKGLLSPYFITSQSSMKVELENVLVLLVDSKVSTVVDLVPLLEKIIKSGKSLITIAEDVDGEALSTFVVNNGRGILKNVAVQLPSFGALQKEMVGDLAALTGATIITPETGKGFETIELKDLGLVKKAIVTREKTTLVTDKKKSKVLKIRVEQIESELKKPDLTNEAKANLEKRLAKLDGGVVVVKVGAATEIELKEKKDRIDDSLHATTAAIEQGIIPGGGVSLLSTLSSLIRFKGHGEAVEAGVEVVRKAIEEPFKQMAINGDLEPTALLTKVIENKDESFGFNFKTKKFGDMFEMGVIDPTKVTREAVQNAGSIASLMLTTDVLIIEDKEDETT